MRKLALVALLFTATQAKAAAPIAGKWLTTEKDSIMEIGPCGAAMCGKVFKILKPAPGGGVALDRNNPDPAMRSRPILGITLFKNFKDGGKDWSGGTLYDPRAGKEYKGSMVKLANGNLKITGCWGPFCRSMIFTPTM